jgi:hypothetical protein
LLTLGRSPNTMRRLSCKSAGRRHRFAARAVARLEAPRPLHHTSRRGS